MNIITISFIIMIRKIYILKPKLKVDAKANAIAKLKIKLND